MTRIKQIKWVSKLNYVRLLREGQGKRRKYNWENVNKSRSL